MSPGEPEREPALRVRNWSASRASGFRVTLRDLVLRPGEAVALTGPSGCGKSTVLRGLVGVEDPVSVTGKVEIEGHAVPVAGSPAWRSLMFRDVTWIPQDARAALDPLQPVGAQLEQATGASRDAVVEALGELGIERADELARRYPHQISGGQAQRVCVALARLRRSKLVLADEPTASLDEDRLDDVVRTFEILRREQDVALLVATHDLDLVAALGARTYVREGEDFRETAAARRPWPRFARDVSSALSLAVAGRGVGLRRGGDWLVRGFDLEVPVGQVIALVGPSGAGKTTVARMLAGHVSPTEGRVERAGNVASVQLLFQDAAGSFTPGRSVQSLVAEVAASDFDIAREAGRLGLTPEHLQRPAAELSGGEQRRAALLRALAVRPAAVLLDEPTAGLDREAAIPVVEFLMECQRRTEVAYLLITHDSELAESVADAVVRIEAGRRVPDGS